MMIVIVFNHDSERGSEFTIIKVCGFWGFVVLVDFGGIYKLLYFFSLQS